MSLFFFFPFLFPSLSSRLIAPDRCVLSAQTFQLAPGADVAVWGPWLFLGLQMDGGGGAARPLIHSRSQWNRKASKTCCFAQSRRNVCTAPRWKCVHFHRRALSTNMLNYSGGYSCFLEVRCPHSSKGWTHFWISGRPIGVFQRLMLICRKQVGRCVMLTSQFIFFSLDKIQQLN